MNYKRKHKVTIKKEYDYIIVYFLYFFLFSFSISNLTRSSHFFLSEHLVFSHHTLSFNFIIDRTFYLVYICTVSDCFVITERKWRMSCSGLGAFAVCKTHENNRKLKTAERDYDSSKNFYKPCKLVIAI